MRLFRGLLFQRGRGIFVGNVEYPPTAWSR